MMSRDSCVSKVQIDDRSPWILSRLLVVATVLLVSTSCSWLGETRQVQSVASPDGTFVADWYDFGGGGAVGNVSSYVRLRIATEPFRLKSDYVFAIDDYGIADVKWISRRELQIRYSSRVMVMRAEPAWRDVTISYVVYPDLSF
jgi:hypothetical protein